MLSVRSFVSMKKVANSVFRKDMNSSEEEYCALLLLAEEEEEEAAIPKKDRRLLVQQHFEMRPVLVEFNTTSHELFQPSTGKLSDMHFIIYHQN